MKSNVEVTMTELPRVIPQKPAAPVPVEPRTPEQILQDAKDLHKAMGWGEPEEPVVIAPPATPTPAPASVPPAPAPPAPTPTPPAEPEPPAPLSTEAIIAQTAKATARELVDLTKPEPVPAPEPPTFEMGEEDSDDYKVIQFMESKGMVAAGMADKFLAYTKAHYAYQDKWLADNPEATEFDPDATDHKAWYAANPFPLDKKAIERGQLKMLVDEAAEAKYRERIQPQMDALESDRAWQENGPKVATNVVGQLVTMVDSVDPQLSAFLKVNGKVDISAAGMERLKTADKISYRVLEKLSGDGLLIPMLTELEKLGIPQMKYRLNPRSNPVHRQIQQHQQDAERDLAAAPAADTLRDGKKFLTVAEMERREDAIISGNGSEAKKRAAVEDLRSTHYCLGLDDMQAIIVDDYARKARALIAEYKEIAGESAQPPQVPTVASGQPAPVIPAPVATPTPYVRPQIPSSRPSPPSLSSGSDVVTGGKPSGETPKTFGEEVADHHFK